MVIQRVERLVVLIRRIRCRAAQREVIAQSVVQVAISLIVARVVIRKVVIPVARTLLITYRVARREVVVVNVAVNII